MTGVRRGCCSRAGETETLGVLPLAGRMSGFHPSCFFTETWLNVLLVPEEGPSVVTRSISVSRRCRMPPPCRGAAEAGQSQHPLEQGGLLVHPRCRTHTRECTNMLVIPFCPFLHISHCAIEKKNPVVKTDFHFITYLAARDNVFNLV